MVNQTLLMMKQPQLGKTIQQQRLSKGMTQEELVERCNINVRTIQRIEAGEVTPRAYTIKSIMEVLEIPILPELEESVPPPIPPLFSQSDKQQLWWTGVAGIIYFMLSSYEILYELVLNANDGPQHPVHFNLLKAGVLVSFITFNYGFYLIARRIRNLTLKFGVVSIILVNSVMIGMDIYTGKVVGLADLGIGVMEMVTFGISLIPLSIGLVLAKKQLGQLYLVAGVFGLCTALLFVTVILSLLGTLTWAVFDIICIYLLFWQAQKQSDFSME